MPILCLLTCLALGCIFPEMTYAADARPSQQETFLRTEGLRIVDGEGKTVILRGGVIDVTETPAPALFAGAGCNSIRLILDYKESGFERLDAFLEEARRQDLWVVLCMRSWPGVDGRSDGAISWTNRQNLETLIEAWTKIAERYKDNPIIAAYDLLYDPHPPSTSEYALFVQELADNIRGEDLRHILMVEEPRSGAGLFDFGPDIRPIYGENIVYGFEEHEPADFTRQGIRWEGRWRPARMTWPSQREEEARIVAEGARRQIEGKATEGKRKVRVEAISPPDAEFVLPRLYLKGSGRARFQDVVLEEVVMSGRQTRDQVVFADTFSSVGHDYQPVGWWAEPADAKISRIRGAGPGTGAMLLSGSRGPATAQPFTGLDFHRLPGASANRRYRLTVDVEVDEGGIAGIAIDFLGTKKSISDSSEIFERFKDRAEWEATVRAPLILTDFWVTSQALDAGAEAWFRTVCQAAEQKEYSWFTGGLGDHEDLPPGVKWGLVRGLLSKYAKVRPKVRGTPYEEPPAVVHPRERVSEQNELNPHAEPISEIPRQTKAGSNVAQKGNPVPPPGVGCWFGAYCPEFPGEHQSTTTFDSIMRFMRKVKKMPAWVQIYHAWTQPDGTWTRFPDEELREIVAADAIPVIQWDPFISPKLARQETSLSYILDGRADTYIFSWADSARRFGQPMIVRITAETEKSAKVFCHVVDLFERRGAQNISWMWAPFRFPASDTQLHRKTNWPGEQYVDWIGLSFFGMPDPDGQKASFSSDELTHLLKSYADYGKPLCLSEMAAASVDNQASWWAQALGHVRSSTWPGVQALILTETPKNWRSPAVDLHLRNDAAYGLGKELSHEFFRGGDQR